MGENRTEGSRKRALYYKSRGELHRADKVAVVRRSVWYILRTVLIIFAIIVLCYAVFTETMYVSNLYIIVTEGMEKRADCILSSGGVLELSDYFDEYWLSADTALYAGKYDSFHVEAYDYRISIESIRVYPWSSSAKLVVVERIPSISAEAFDDSNEEPVPKWDNARYEISLEKLDGRWLITKLAVLEYDPEPKPGNTPDYSQLETYLPVVRPTSEP